MKNYLQQNKYSEVNITEHKQSHHDEMKTSTEYKKRKHMITQGRRRSDSRNRIEEIEKVFSQCLETDMNRHTTTDMKK